MDRLYNEIYSRNIGIITKAEQKKLQQSTIAIAGVGGVGGLLAERLIRLGVGRLKITDPGIFKKSNLNRQFSSSTLSLGRNKAEVVYEQLKNINPAAQIDVSNEGIKTDTDAIHFVQNCDLIIDQMDFGLFKESIWLQRAARQRNIFYLFAYAIGFGAIVVNFNPCGLTLEEYDNLSPNVELNNIKNIHVPLERIMPVMPSYAPATTHDILKKIDTIANLAPAISIGVGLASILAANEATNIILKRREITAAPKYTYIDLLDLKFVVGTASL